MKGLKEVVKEKEDEMKHYLNNINQIENNITVQKEFIKNEYRQQ